MFHITNDRQSDQPCAQHLIGFIAISNVLYPQYGLLSFTFLMKGNYIQLSNNCPLAHLITNCLIYMHSLITAHGEEEAANEEQSNWTEVISQLLNAEECMCRVCVCVCVCVVLVL